MKLSTNSVLNKFFFIGLALCPLEATSWGAACCAKNSATPSLIVGDDQSMFNVGVAFGNVVADVTDEGYPYFKSPDTSDLIQTYRLDGATLLTDRLQLGVSVNVVNHAVSTGNNQGSFFGFGDSRLSLGYELLPSWTYSAWRPQIYLFEVTTFPTGRSVYESQSATASDVVGNGFYSFSVGTLVMKRWNLWDVFIIPEVHYSLPRTFNSIGQDFEVVSGFGGSLGVGFGYSPWEGPLRLGFRVQPRIDQPKSVPSIDGERPGTAVTSCDTGFDASYLLGTTDTLMISYTDQTLLGPAANSNLSRVFALNFQHRWER